MENLSGIGQGNTREKDESEKLSKSVLESINKKVEDIFHEGTAFHHLTFREQFRAGDIRRIDSICSPHEVVKYLNTLSENIEEVFVTGLMGARYIIDGKVTGEKYRKSLRDHMDSLTKRGMYEEGQDKKPSIFFHIFGRIIDPVDTSVNSNHNLDKWLGTYAWNSGITILFNTPSDESFGPNKSNSIQPPIYPLIKKNEYSLSMGGMEARVIARLRDKYPDIKPNDPRILDFLRDARENMSDENYETFKRFFTAEGKTKTSSGEGFRAPLRIAPRKFKGIVVNVEFLEKKGLIFKEDLIEQGEEISEDELSERFFQFLEKIKVHDIDYECRLKNIVRMLINIMKKTDTFIPVYDENGNLLWPEKKSNEEIVEMKKFDKK